jgi:hypothetical protein
MRYAIVRALWACADALEIVRDGIIVTASRLVGRGCIEADIPPIEHLPHGPTKTLIAEYCECGAHVKGTTCYSRKLW